MVAVGHSLRWCALFTSLRYFAGQVHSETLFKAKFLLYSRCRTPILRITRRYFRGKVNAERSAAQGSATESERRGRLKR